MVTINVSNDTRVKLLNMKTAEIGSAEKVILNLMSNGQSPTLSTDADYSQCPNCEKLQNAIYAQDSTIEGLKTKIPSGGDKDLIKANEGVIANNKKLNARVNELEEKYEGK